MERHEFDLISFLFGLLFSGLAAAWLITEQAFDANLSEWFWPVVLVVGGVVVLSSAVSRRSVAGDGDALEGDRSGGDSDWR